ncbi:MAG: MYXO-CTERM sorting domain-containing protein [Limisphaerales bacterium]
MNWQQAVSLTIVAAVAGLLLWGRFRRRKFSFARDTHCGCGAPGQAETKSSIVFHARKGERPAVMVRMK